MLFKIFKVDETSKTSAFRVSIFNLVLTVLLTAALIGFAISVSYYYDGIEAIQVSRLIFVEVALNCLFFPFAISLIIGVKKNKYRWISIWIKAKVVQASYIFLLNFVMQLYITVSLNVGDGLVVLVYTLVIEAFYMENIVYMNNYQRNRQPKAEDISVPKQVVEEFVIKV
ncbi:hypothetical protein TcasGA2_TC032841 [Tribolium castaneum]|uniref:Uncharacterized protein n=1 Tax=Tribolium castaneum TaxID=7070 RepID=A0A139WJG8_TRICA|nr:PREDICTED: uncharacterized protein LOC103312713 [Tribolium castaneum]KYB28024.1 hypothetical protein TcasGA2_TC032841 [Tribolium castaneum]|eukprot:XP_008192314.1 PREDICTED: uncharacterized protein LOC103312713 [Tribolium castaneum]